MRKTIILAVLVLLVTVVAIPMGLCTQPSYGAIKAEVRLNGVLTVPPVLKLKVNNIEAIAPTGPATVTDPSPMELTAANGNAPTPGKNQKVEAFSDSYRVEVYSNDYWRFFMYRTDLEWAEGIDFLTEMPVIYYHKKGYGNQWNGHNFYANLPYESNLFGPAYAPTDNEYRFMGEYKFSAKYDAGTRPGTYSFTVGFVAYQE